MDMDGVEYGSVPIRPPRIGRIGLLHLDNGYCPRCHNLSLQDHGPWNERDDDRDYFSYFATGEAVLVKNWTTDYVNTSKHTVELVSLLPAGRCQYCSMLRESVTYLEKPLPLIGPGQFVSIRIQLIEALNIVVEVAWKTSEKGGFCFEIYQTDEQRYVSPVPEGLARVSSKDASKSRYPFDLMGWPSYELPPFCGIQSIDFLDNRMQTCFGEHASCGALLTSDPPTRLLYVGSSDDQIRVVDAGPAIAPISYCALSYCWGRNGPFKTTRSNLASLKEQVPRRALSPVFRDAIQLTRRYDLQHIWIDSLCIVQDNPQELAAEAGRMAAIFGNAAFVIAATRCKDGTQPLFGSSAPYENRFMEFRIRSHSGDSCITKVRITSNTEKSITVDLQNSVESVEGPLVERGWTYQEVILSQRCMAFSDKGIWWRCQQHSGSEAWSVNVEVRSLEKILDDWSTEFWRCISFPYSERTLTYFNDRLPAMAGLAAWYEERASKKLGPLTYLAGLWLHIFDPGIMWHRTKFSHQKRSFRPAEYAAPSWSWASVNDACDPSAGFETGTYELLIDLVDWSCEPKTANKFGEVKADSFIVIRGRALDVELLPTKSDGMYSARLPGKTESGAMVFSDYVLHNCVGVNGAAQGLTARAASQRDVDRARIPGWRGRAKCLLVSNGNNFCIGLLLGGFWAPETYERIGIVRWKRTSFMEWQGTFDAAQVQDFKVM